MKTAQEREAAFRAEFAELLKKHGAEIDITDDRKPYGQHNGIVEVTMMNRFQDGETVEEYTAFRL